MSKQIPMLMESPLTKRVFVVTSYKDKGNGIFEAHQKYDVTEQFDALAEQRSGTCNPEETETITYYDEYDNEICKLTAERDEWKAKCKDAERAMNAAAGKWAKADDENRELRKMLLLDDGTVEEYTERADPSTALAYQKQLAEEWRDRCHNAEAWCDKLESERDEWKAKAEAKSAKRAEA